MSLDELLAQVRSGEPLVFQDVQAVIAAHYDYTPTRFTNGGVVNEAGSNEGSCRTFAFARRHGLNEAETLALFGEHHRAVLAHPEGGDHANIRAFMTHGWEDVAYLGEALKAR
jgi:hypothetical protein